MFSSNTTQVAADGGYQISRSLRFNSADTTYLGRTPSTNGSGTKGTFNFWVKRSNNRTDGEPDNIYTSAESASNQYRSILDLSTSGGSNNLRFYGYNSGGSLVLQLETTAVLRDPSAWYCITVNFDTTQATSANRAKMYINNVEQTAFNTATYPTQNTELGFFKNLSAGLNIGSNRAGNAPFASLYLADFNAIDGTALTPSSFGETNAQTGVWQPKAYSGSYGTNGFYLNFSDNSNTTAATLGKDYSGNGNNWTPNNFSVTAGIGNDSLVDSPTSYGTTDTGVGGEIRGNYCTLNPLAKASQMTVRNGNLDCIADGSWRSVLSTFGMTTGKWYWEQSIVSGVNMFSGIAKGNMDTSSFIGYIDANGWGYYNSNGYKWNNGSGSAYGASVAAGDIVGIAFDADAGTLTFYKNGTSQGTAFSGLTSGPYFPAASSETQTVSINFGQRPFAYTAPSGFKALCTQNLPTPTIGATTATQAGKYFNPVLYTGNGGTNNITGVGFQPDWVWVKGRSGATSHALFDAVRGVQKRIVSNNSNAESTETTALSAFGSDGFTTGALTDMNTSSATYVAWNWKANGSGSTNTAGSITSTVSANTTSGFSIVTYTGTGANATVGHGLGVAPSFIIIKRRDDGSSWNCYQISLGASQYIQIDGTAGAATNTGVWNNTAPTSTVFSIGTAFAGVNASGSTHVAYCFAEVAGYSKFASYTGNGSTDGPFVFTGMRPSFFMLKNTTTAGDDWQMIDVARGTYNLLGPTLVANGAGAENTYTICDFLSNGVKFRDSGRAWNKSGDLYIYMAFASNPFKTSLAR